MEGLEEIRRRVDELRGQDRRRDSLALLEEAAREHEAAGSPDLGSVLYELAQDLSMLERHEEAIAAMRRALDLGFTDDVDPRARMGGILHPAGYRNEAEALWTMAAQAASDPFEVCRVAGLECFGGDDDEAAVRWLGRAMVAAIQGGYPDEVVAELSDLRRVSLSALGRELDDLERRVDARLGRVSPGGPEEPGGVAPPQYAIAWFPADQWPEAHTRWPALLDGIERNRAHAEYCRHIQLQLLAVEREVGVRASVAPIAVDEYVARCEEQGEPPGGPDTLAMHASEVAARGDAIAWPPGRNDPCWCGSGTKYKRCCGTVTLPRS